jgi:O-antigen ligase
MSIGRRRSSGVAVNGDGVDLSALYGNGLNSLVGRMGIVFRPTILVLTSGVLVASIVFGGGTHSGFLSDVLLQLAALPLLWVALTELVDEASGPRLKGPLIFITAVVSLPLMQLLPLPASVWTLLPGHDVVSNVYVLLGERLPARPLTLSPTATWLSALAILPPLAIFLGTVALDYAQRRAITLILIAMGVLSTFLGLLQLAGGTGSALRFYAITNRTEAVGFFANRNHLAALLYSSMLFSILWSIDGMIRLGRQTRRHKIDSLDFLHLTCASVAFAALLAGQLMARSRAGLVLSIAALLGGIALALSDRRAKSFGAGSARFIIGATAVTVIFSLQFALYRIIDRFGADSVTGDRIAIVRNTIAAARTYMPFGSGLGTFVPVYQMFEKPSDIGVAYINHAHNDVLELWLEAGIPGLLLMAVYVVWLVRRMAAVWRGDCPYPIPSFDLSVIRAGSIVLLLLPAHSLVDYPLRTYAMAAIAAFCTALLIQPAPDRNARDAVVGMEAHEAQQTRKGFGGQKTHCPHKAGRKASHRRPTQARELLGQSVSWPAAWIRTEANIEVAPASPSDAEVPSRES